MPRTLPWLKEPPAKATPTRSLKPHSKHVNQPTRTATSPVPHTAKRRRLEVAETPQRSAPSNADASEDEDRAISSSPPVAPDPQSPFRPYEDDRWIMVEDEFNATAQLFTSHLHRAEYKRLKKKAAETSAQALAERPTDGKTPRSLMRDLQDARNAQRSSTSAAVKALGGVSDDELSDLDGVGDEGLAIPDPNLANLMLRVDTKVNSRTRLDGLIRSPVKSRTRAAAGFGKQVVDKSRYKTLGELETTRADLVGPLDEEDEISSLESNPNPNETSLPSKVVTADPNEFPFARSSLVQRKARPVKREKDRDSQVGGVPTFLF